MKNLVITILTLFVGLTAFAQDGSHELKEASIRLIEEGLAARQLTYSLVGHAVSGKEESSDGKINPTGTSGDILNQFISYMRQTLNGPATIDNNQIVFTCSDQNGDCDLSMTVAISAEDRANGVADHANLRFTIEIENGQPVRIKNNRLALHVYSSQPQ